MKIVQLILAILITTFTAKAQFLGGFFSQNKTQIKYYLEQISALKANKEALVAGYKLVKNGGKLIGDIKNGSFSLDKSYFNHQAFVPAKVIGYSKVRSIYEMESKILRGSYLITPYINDLSPQTASAARKNISATSQAASRELDELLLIIENGATEMTEDARIQAIDRIYLRVQRLYSRQLLLLRQAAIQSQNYQLKNKDLSIQHKLFE